jgi:hypothetical protein
VGKPLNLSPKHDVQPDLRNFQQQLVRLFTNEQERAQFLQSTNTACATFQNIQELPKAPVIVYADLLKTTADGVMSSIFPAIRTYFDQSEWTDLLQNYSTIFLASHYRLNAIAQNFSQYLRQTLPEKAWLAEIADYEYQELAVEEIETEPLAEDSTASSFTPLLSQTELMTLCPLLNETICHRRYSFDVVDAVNSILEDGQIAVVPLRQSTIVVFFRDPDTHRCRQLKLGPLAASVLLAATQEQSTYVETLHKCVAVESNAKIENRLAELLAIVNDFHEANLFTGNFKSASNAS